MAITDSNAITFCNEHARVAADLMLKTYGAIASLNSSWNAMDGTTAEKVEVFKRATVKTSALLANTYIAVKLCILKWDALGMSSVIPNESSNYVQDGAPDDGRQRISGADVRNVVNRCLEFEGWLSGGSFSSPVSLRGYSKMIPFVRLTRQNVVYQDAWVAECASTLAVEFLAHYAANPSHVTHLRRLAVVESD